MRASPTRPRKTRKTIYERVNEENVFLLSFILTVEVHPSLSFVRRGSKSATLYIIGDRARPKFDRLIASIILDLAKGSECSWLSYIWSGKRVSHEMHVSNSPHREAAGGKTLIQ